MHCCGNMCGEKLPLWDWGRTVTAKNHADITGVLFACTSTLLYGFRVVTIYNLLRQMQKSQRKKEKQSLSVPEVKTHEMCSNMAQK